MIEEGTLVTAAFVFIPAAIWIAVALERSSSPVRALLAVGAAHGVLLAATHQLLWTEAYDGDPAQLGGELAGRYSQTAEELILRGSAVFSSLLAGLAMGVVTGLVATAVAKARARP